MPLPESQLTQYAAGPEALDLLAQLHRLALDAGLPPTLVTMARVQAFLTVVERQQTKHPMKFEVNNRWTRAVQFTAEIDCDKNTNYPTKLGLAVKWGRSNEANLRWANLAGVDLVGANLVGADLVGANLVGANLAGVDLAGADLVGANLVGADLVGANLVGANLVGANLVGANLRWASLAGAYLNKEEDIRLQGNNPLITISPIGSANGTLFAYQTNKGIYLRRGCFFGTLRDFRLAVKATHGDNEHGVFYRTACKFVETWASRHKSEISA